MALSKGFSTSERSHTTTRTEAAALPILLIVDDEQEITTTLADQFRRDYRVKVAGGTDEALTILKQPSDSLVERADKAMYLAKQKGRNRVETAGEKEEGVGQ